MSETLILPVSCVYVCVWTTDNIFLITCISNQPELHPLSRFCVRLNYKLCSGSTSQLTRHCLGSRPHSSLLITNEPAPASRFLQRLPVLPHLCHLLSPALFLSLPLPLPFPFSTLFRHTLPFFFFCGREHKTRRLLSGQRGAEEERREIERKAQEEEGGCELSNRIKGEQRNGEHLKYS